jgi:sialate O-acetylesterase
VDHITFVQETLSLLSCLSRLGRKVCLLGAAAVMTLVSSWAEELPFVVPICGEHMMLQRGRSNEMWGWTAPDAEIRLRIGERTAVGRSGADGAWRVAIEPPATVGPHTLTIEGPEYREFRDVLVGDVWLCAGQSNMEFPLHRSLDGAEAVEHSTNDRIRLFRMKSRPAYAPQRVPDGVWRRCEPSTFNAPDGFSAVAYYFARKLQQETDVPIGLIQAAVGGTPAESWMSPQALADFPEFAPGLDRIAQLDAAHAPLYGSEILHWYDQFDRGIGEGWSRSDFDNRAWTPTNLHDAFVRLSVAARPAVVWLRREFELPTSLPTGEIRLRLGKLENMDTVWVNGQLVGMGSSVDVAREYLIPPGLCRPGRNQITIRVFKTAADGGFRSPPGSQKLSLGDGSSIVLEEGWRAAVGAEVADGRPIPRRFEHWPVMPAVLDLGMIRPLAGISLAGAVWYQGESNVSDPALYRRLLPALIADWRETFSSRDLPFYLVSLPAYMRRRPQPGGTDGWTEVREVQLRTAATMPHAGVVVTTDLGDAEELHPPDKRPVGERLARLALRDIYRRDVVSEGPVFRELETISGGLRVHFANASEGLVIKGGAAEEFSIAGIDRRWHWAVGRVEGDTVVVSAPGVPNPVAVRYAWQANPRATLFNRAGLPAKPFRTVDW